MEECERGAHLYFNSAMAPKGKFPYEFQVRATVLRGICYDIYIEGRSNKFCDETAEG